MMSEIVHLVSKYGEPVTHHYDIHCTQLFGPVCKMDRQGEVVFVLRRPGGKVLVSTKSFYPPHIYRLPSGGIGLQEKIEDALLREIAEETGLAVRITRFLAILRYTFHVGSINLGFISYVFELDAPAGEPALNEEESITGYMEVDSVGLREIASQLRNLPEDRRPWGEFRALVHDVVADLL